MIKKLLATFLILFCTINVGLAASRASVMVVNDDTASMIADTAAVSLNITITNLGF